MTWPRLAGLAVVVAVATGCGQSGRPASATKPAASAAAQPSPDSERQVPVRLVIPRLGVDAEVEEVGVDSNGNMDVPTGPTKVGWYGPGVVPGQPGDAVFDGHLDWTNGPAVFYELGRLQAGDEISILVSNWTRLRFQVTQQRRAAYDTRPDVLGLFSKTGEPRISLITCTGDWDRGRQTYLERLIVHARLVGEA